ncbi:hypothetical protein BH10BAC5_BH10BAC5_08840 [soil metagenome]
MSFLYHFVRKDLRGDILYPLNMLKTVYPDLYSIQSAKYKDREQLMGYEIPILNCLWNDVLHFSAVHPKKIARAFELAGEPDRHFECFEIDPYSLEMENTIVFLYSGKTMQEHLNLENFIAYNPEELARHVNIPDETIEYYREKLSQDKRPLLFHLVPHILYKGSINISNVKRVNA